MIKCRRYLREKPRFVGMPSAYQQTTVLRCAQSVLSYRECGMASLELFFGMLYGFTVT